MVVAFDNSVLCLLLHPGVDVPNDPATGNPVSRAQDRIAYLVEQLRESRSRILIPTPVLAEFLTFASADYLEEINSSAHFQIAPFDQRAAIEAGSTMRRARLGPGGKKLGLDASWQKVKIDWQVASIAKVGGAAIIYTTDSDLGTIAEAFALTTAHVAELELPPPRTPLLETLDD
jgi:predicted nucleic acid-binding protein